MDPVRQAEIEHEQEQDAIQERKDAFINSGRFDECVIEKYHEYLEDSLRMWEALGPDGFQAPCPRLNTIFGNCQNKAAEVLFESHLACAIKDHDALALGDALLKQAQAYLMKQASNYVELNWDSYEEEVTMNESPTTEDENNHVEMLLVEMLAEAQSWEDCQHIAEALQNVRLYAS